jgi:hypothetical protein
MCLNDDFQQNKENLIASKNEVFDDTCSYAEENITGSQKEQRLDPLQELCCDEDEVFLRQYVQEEDFEDFYVDVLNCDEYVAPKAIMNKVARNLKRLTL